MDADRGSKDLQRKIDVLEDEVVALDQEVFRLRQEVKATQYNGDKLRAIQRLASAGGWELNQVSGGFDCSAELAAILCAEPESLVSWSDFIAWVHPDERAMVADALDQSVLAKEPFEIEHRMVLANAEVRYVKHHCKSFYAATGMLVSSIGNLQDITALKLEMAERKRVEGELRLAQKLEAVGQLASGIAHEINTPVQYIGNNINFLKTAYEEYTILVKAYQDALAAAPLSEETQQALGEAEDEADLAYLQEELPSAFSQAAEGVERVRGLVLAMKEFAHPGGREMSPADINHALLNAITVACSEYKYVAEVETDLADLPHVSCMIGELNQVFLNLLVNAAHAIAQVVGDSGEKGLIQIVTSSEDQWVNITFQDSGCGIPEAIHERVFDPFFTTKDVGEGSGQGLAIARSIVCDKHGGELALESEEGKGTIFTIRLPL
ncbi:MAG: PAS domain-containing protein [Candidatus Thiodiazotropha sp. (ex Troendleina suluensis)]|nr:PAS domain-containing protein [Candidatus Thiodiazotropha sp. (ex Troendleina suluensis)]